MIYSILAVTASYDIHDDHVGREAILLSRNTSQTSPILINV